MKLLLISLLFIGCTKQKVCYECKLSNGKTEKVCGKIPEFTDSYGNQLGATCTEK